MRRRRAHGGHGAIATPEVCGQDGWRLGVQRLQQDLLPSAVPRRHGLRNAPCAPPKTQRPTWALHQVFRGPSQPKPCDTEAKRGHRVLAFSDPPLFCIPFRGGEYSLQGSHDETPERRLLMMKLCCLGSCVVISLIWEHRSIPCFFYFSNLLLMTICPCLCFNISMHGKQR
jgi:hypothetical protein